MKVNWKYLAGGAVLAVAGSALMSVIPPPNTSQDWAAWVQGVGTILAVGVAAWAGMLPAELERARKREERAALARTIRYAADRAMLGVPEVLFHLEDSTGLAATYLGSMPKDAVTQLQALLNEPPTTWPSAAVHDVAAALLKAVQQVHSIDPASLLGSTGPAGRPFEWHRLQWLLEEATSHRGFLDTALNSPKD